MIIINLLTNDEIRNIVDEVYFLNLEDRIIIDALIHYAFVLKENVKDISDDDIETARKYAIRLANKYETSKGYYKYYDDKFKKFVNQQRFKAITKCDYDLIKKEIYEKINAFAKLSNNGYWSYKVYYNIDYKDALVLANERVSPGLPLTMTYDIKKNTISNSGVKLTNDVILLDELNKHSLLINDDYDLDRIKI